MSRLVREGIAYARSSESLEETTLKLELNAWINSIACDYQDIGKNVQFQASEPAADRHAPQALRRVMTNLLDNALKFGERAVIAIDDSSPNRWLFTSLTAGREYPMPSWRRYCSRFIGLKHRATAIPAEQDSDWRLPRS
jgi:K+-sensing histidine kinase KdpD